MSFLIRCSFTNVKSNCTKCHFRLVFKRRHHSRQQRRRSRSRPNAQVTKQAVKWIFFCCCFVLCVHAERKPCRDTFRRPAHRSCCGVWRQHKRVTTSLRRKLTPNVSSCVRPVSPSEGVAVAATQNRHSRCQRWDGVFRVSTQTNGLLHVSHRTLGFH